MTEPKLIEIIPNKVYEVHNLLTASECDHFINYIKENFVEYSKRNKADLATRYVEHPHNQEQANFFWDRLKGIVPQQYEGRKLSYISDRLPIAMYKSPVTAGTRVHVDVSPNPDEVYAMVVYLNDNFEGGETGVFADDNDTELAKIVPKKGNGMLFQIKSRHRGYPTKGIKYIMRPRICYQ